MSYEEVQAQQLAAQHLENGAENDGTTLTKEQCKMLIDYMQERFDEGYGCGANNAVQY